MDCGRWLSFASSDKAGRSQGRESASSPTQNLVVPACLRESTRALRRPRGPHPPPDFPDRLWRDKRWRALRINQVRVLDDLSGSEHALGFDRLMRPFSGNDPLGRRVMYLTVGATENRLRVCRRRFVSCPVSPPSRASNAQMSLRGAFSLDRGRKTLIFWGVP